MNPPLAPGTTNISATTQSYYYTDNGCSFLLPLSPTGQTLTAIRVNIKQDGTTITGTTRNVIVGQKISLTAEVQPTGGTLTNQRWTIPGVRVANYVPNGDSGTVTALPANPGGPAVDYYWVDGGDGRQVQFSVKVNGKSFTAIATFNVKRPTATFTSTSAGNVACDFACGSELRVHYGCNASPGITFSLTNVVIPAGFSGDTQLVQVANSTTRTKLRSGVMLTKSGTNLLDTTFPYGILYDAPGEPFDPGDIQITANDSFTIYVIFKPSSANSVWVPIRKLSWSWAGDGLFSRTLNSSSHSASQGSSDATDHPQWSGNVISLEFH